MRVILASKSPRRKELLELITKKYEVLVSDVDETFAPGLTIIEQSKRLAYMKAKKVFDDTKKGERIVIGSDTMVVKKDKIFGKPQDRDEAIFMIKELKNAEHEVITSLAVLVLKDGKYREYIDYDITKVHIKDMSEEEIIKWVDTGKAYDKAGAYAIQGEFGVFVDKIDGNYFTVVGLPIHKLYDIFKDI
ncbi:MAG: Maf family protein [Clostridia bacterium]|nr:Maf family protein [Clostridia bacterium]